MTATVLPAAVGAFAGFVYARRTLDPAGFERLGGLYSAAGAAAAILLLRVVGLFAVIAMDYLGRRNEPPS
jgi:hypothetical protein